MPSPPSRNSIALTIVLTSLVCLVPLQALQAPHQHPLIRSPHPANLSRPSPLIMSSSAATDFVLPVSLADSPRLHFADWLKATHQYARSLEPTIDLYGALYLMCDDVTWKSLSKNIVPVTHDGMGPAPAPTIRPRPRHLPPNAPSRTDNATSRAIAKRALDLHEAEANAEAALVRVLLASIGEKNRALLEEAGTDLLDVTPRGIVTAMTAEHGQLEPDDLLTKRLGFSNKLPSVELFSNHVHAFRKLISELRAHPLPPLDYFHLFRETLSPFPQFHPYLTAYDIAHPTTSSKTFESLASFLTPHLPALRSLSSSSSVLPAGCVAPLAPAQGDVERLKAEVAALQRKLHGRQPPSSPGPAPTPSAPSAHHLYCYHHGWNFSHGRSTEGVQSGGECSVMGKHRRGDFTDAQRAARSPSDCPGGSSRVQANQRRARVAPPAACAVLSPPHPSSLPPHP